MYTDYEERIVYHEPKEKFITVENKYNLRNAKTLIEKLNKLCKQSSCSKTKFLFQDYLTSIEYGDRDHYEQCRKLFQSLNPPERLLDPSFKSDFIKSPSIESQLFSKIKLQNENIKNLLNDIDREELNESFFNLVKDCQDYIQDLVNSCLESIKSGKEISEDIFKKTGTIIIEANGWEQDIDFNDAYKISCYDPNEYCYKKENERGNSYGRIIDGIYFKVDRNSNLLEPIKEYMVYNFYFFLFNTESYISKTQLIFLKNVPILPELDLGDDLDSIENQSKNLRKQLEDFRIKISIERNLQEIISIKEAFSLNPELESKMLKSLNETLVMVQASFVIQGQSLEDFLNEVVDNTSLLDKLDRESFSAHVIASFILYPTDYKPDNFIVEKDTYRIVGIDNNAALDSDELRKNLNKNAWYVDIKNILYTLPLMDEPIHPNIRTRILKRDPYCLMYDWLIQSYCGEIELMYSIENAASNTSKTIDEILNSLSMETKIPGRFLRKMLDRLILIQNEVEKDENITLWQLFEKINYFLSKFYKSLEDFIPSNILDDEKSRSDKYSHIRSKYIYQFFVLYNDDIEYTECIRDHSKLDSKTVEEVIEKLKETKFYYGQFRIDNNKEVIGLYQCINVCLLMIDIGSFKEDFYVKSIIDLVRNSFRSFKRWNFNVPPFPHSFHSSWKTHQYQIVKSLIRTCSLDTLEFFIVHFDVDLNDVNSLEESAFHVALNSNLPIYIVRDQIIILEENKANIHVKNKGVTVLDLAIKNRLIEMKNPKPKNEWDKIKVIGLASENDNSVIKLLILCGCIAENHNQFFEYYFSLNYYDRRYLKGVIKDNLYCNNQRLAWEIALSTIFPIHDNKIQLKEGESILKTATLGNRIVNSNDYEQIFQKGKYKVKKDKHENGNVDKCTGCLLDDGCGNKILVKVYPEMPGTEIAIQYFNSKLFETSCNPFLEYALLDDHPILIAQNIPGTTLAALIIELENYDPNDYIFTEQHKDLSAGLKPSKPKELFLIEPYNISQILIGAILMNEGASDFSNFMVYKSGDVQYRIVSSDSYLAFLPSISIKDGQVKMGVHNDIFLLDHMFEFVDNKIIEQIVTRNIDDFMVDWLSHLEMYHESSIGLLKSIKKKEFDQINTRIGIPFAPGQIRDVYSKLIRLKSLFISIGDNRITHFEVFQNLEPYMAIKYKHYLMDESQTLYQKSIISRGARVDFSSTMRLDFKDAPKSDKFMEILYNGGYEPKQATEEYYTIKDQYIKFGKSIKDITILHNEIINEGILEQLLNATDFSTITPQEEKVFFKSLKPKQPKLYSLNIINSSIIDSSILKSTFLFSNLSKINLVNCKSFDGIKSIELPVLSRLILQDCSKLTTIKIKTNQLIELNITNCSNLNSFSVDSPNLERIILKDTLTNQNYKNIIDFINSNFKDSLLFLDIGFSSIRNFDFNQQKDLVLFFPNLEILKASNLVGIEYFILFLTHCKVLEINLSSSKQLIGQMIYLETITPQPPPNDILLNLKKIQISLIGLDEVEVGKPFFEDFFNKISTPTSIFNVKKDNGLITNSQIHPRSEFAIHSKNCSQFVIFFLDLFGTQWEDYNCFTKFNYLISNFKSNNSKEYYQHIQFILIISKPILSEYDDKSIRKLEDIKKKFKFHHKVDLFLELAKKETYEMFYDDLFNIFQNTLDEHNIKTKIINNEK
ncbi:hypothetical protein ACTFIV_006171 [Dictyostelium citrinum]